MSSEKRDQFLWAVEAALAVVAVAAMVGRNYVAALWLGAASLAVLGARFKGDV